MHTITLSLSILVHEYDNPPPKISRATWLQALIKDSLTQQFLKRSFLLAFVLSLCFCCCWLLHFIIIFRFVKFVHIKVFHFLKQHLFHSFNQVLKTWAFIWYLVPAVSHQGVTDMKAKWKQRMFAFAVFKTKFNVRLCCSQTPYLTVVLKSLLSMLVVAQGWVGWEDKQRLADVIQLGKYISSCLQVTFYRAVYFFTFHDLWGDFIPEKRLAQHHSFFRVEVS